LFAKAKTYPEDHKAMQARLKQYEAGKPNAQTEGPSSSPESHDALAIVSWLMHRFTNTVEAPRHASPAAASVLRHHPRQSGLRLLGRATPALPAANSSTNLRLRRAGCVPAPPAARIDRTSSREGLALSNALNRS
jgi:hypothetical protein